MAHDDQRAPQRDSSPSSDDSQIPDGKSGWVRLPFFAVQVASQPEFSYKGGAAFCTNDGAAGAMAVPIPWNASRVEAVRLVGRMPSSDLPDARLEMGLVRQRVPEQPDGSLPSNTRLARVRVGASPAHTVAFDQQVEVPADLRQLGRHDQLSVGIESTARVFLYQVSVRFAH